MIMVVIFNINFNTIDLQIKILKEELSFHQQVYECQVDYVESLLSAVRQVNLQIKKIKSSLFPTK